MLTGKPLLVDILFYLFCPGFDIRIEAYPNSAQRLNFARTYLASAAVAAKLRDANSDGGSSDGASPVQSAGGGGISFADPAFAAALAAVDATNEAAALAHEAHCYELAAHLTWAIWGVCQVRWIRSFDPSCLLCLIVRPHSVSAPVFPFVLRLASRRFLSDFPSTRWRASASFAALLPKLDSTSDFAVTLNVSSFPTVTFFFSFYFLIFASTFSSTRDSDVVVFCESTSMFFFY